MVNLKDFSVIHKELDKGTFASIRSESLPNPVIDVWCYEDKLGRAAKTIKKSTRLKLLHTLNEATVSTIFKSCLDGVDILVEVTGPTSNSVLEINTINPCCQLARSPLFKVKGDYLKDFVARCFIFLDKGLTSLKDTKRNPGTRPKKGDMANATNPWIQEYFPSWRIHPGQIPGRRGYSDDRPIYPIIGVVSRDKKYLVAIAWPETAGLGQVWHCCIHPRPVIGDSYNPRTKKTRSRGKIYIMENEPNKLIAKFKNDFADWRKPPNESRKTVLLEGI